MRNRSWIMVFLVVAAGAFAWRSLVVRPESGADLLEPHAGSTAPEPESVARASSAVGQRTPVLPQPGAPPETEPPPPVIPRSPLARRLDEIAASFLTEQPRVTDLLWLVERLASLAVVDPDSVTVQRNETEHLMSARGPLVIGDLSGRFLIDRDGIGITFDRPLADGPWSRLGLHISFQEGESGARSCHATVQFQRREGEDAASHQEEVLTGWVVGTDPESGTFARPLTMTFVGGTWTTDGSGRVQLQEFPWANSYTSGFDAWLRLLKDCASRER